MNPEHGGVGTGSSRRSAKPFAGLRTRQVVGSTPTRPLHFFLQMLKGGSAMKLNKTLTIILSLAILGVADSSYALYQHFLPPATSSCDVSETISCTAVNQSEYSVILGVPVAAVGIAGYLLIAGLAVGSMIFSSAKRYTSRVMLAIASIGLLFSIWLTWVEIFLLNAICPLCILSLFLIGVIVFMASPFFLLRLV